MFDIDFFGRSFTERIEEFTREHGTTDVRVQVITLGGPRFDVRRIESSDVGAMLYTRDDQMVFLPYQQIAYVEVSTSQDHRVTGFQLSTSSE